MWMPLLKLVLKSPYAWLAIVAGIGVIAGSGYWAGYRHASNAAKADQFEALTRAIEQAEERRAQDWELLESARETIRTLEVRYVEIDRGFDTAEVPDCRSLGHDLTGLLDAAATAANAGQAGQPDGTVPAVGDTTSD